MGVIVLIVVGSTALVGVAGALVHKQKESRVVGTCAAYSEVSQDKETLATGTFPRILQTLKHTREMFVFDTLKVIK